MKRNAYISLPLLTVLIAVVATAQQEPARHDVPLNDEQVREVVKRAIAMQHKSDEALDEYDRTERIVFSDNDQKKTETITRLVPVGGGDMRIEMNRNGKPVPPEEITTAWRDVMGMMESRTHLENPAVKREYEKQANRRQQVAKMVDVIDQAFRFRYVGRAFRNGRPTIELAYDPAPEFKSSLRYAWAYKQVGGKVWVDEASGYVVRLEAELRHDIPVGGGILGKVYRGARMEMEQAEQSSGVWLPTLSSYDVEGRKFLFPASFHRKLFASDYRHIGPPAQALAVLRSEHAQLATNDSAQGAR